MNANGYQRLMDCQSKMASTKTPAQRCKITLLILSSIWLALVITAPFTIPYHSVDNLSGKVSQIDNWKEIDKMNPFAASIYLLGDTLCTEISDHSFYLNGNQMPFCARCTSIFAGLVLGLLIAVIFDPKVNRLLIGLALLPIAFDGGLQLMTSYQSTNLLRVATGLLAGVAISLYFSCIANVALAPRSAGEMKVA